MSALATHLGEFRQFMARRDCTYTAVAPKISALLAFVNILTNRIVKTPINPRLRSGDLTLYRIMIAAVRSKAARMVLRMVTKMGCRKYRRLRRQ